MKNLANELNKFVKSNTQLKEQNLVHREGFQYKIEMYVRNYTYKNPPPRLIYSYTSVLNIIFLPSSSL